MHPSPTAPSVKTPPDLDPGIHAGLNSRLSHVLNLMRHGERLANELVQTRCERGAQVVIQLGFADTVAAGIHNLDDHWNGRGRPDRQGGESIPLGSRIALVARVADVFFQVGGPSAARDEVRPYRDALPV